MEFERVGDAGREGGGTEYHFLFTDSEAMRTEGARNPVITDIVSRDGVTFAVVNGKIHEWDVEEERWKRPGG